MKKRIILLIILCTFLSAGLKGNKYIDDTYGYEITAANGWIIDISGAKKLIVITSRDNMSEAAVDIVPFDPEMKDARDVAISQIEAYDGWEYIAGRPMAWNEKHGADNGFSCMYNKRMFTRGEGEKLIIVQEYYFVKKKRALVLTLVTDNNRWGRVKKGLLFMRDSFYIK